MRPKQEQYTLQVKVAACNNEVPVYPAWVKVSVCS